MKQGNMIALISSIAKKAHNLIIRELEAQGLDGIVPSHGDILAQLLTGKEYTMQELAKKIHRTKPTVTVLIDKLVDLGYVTKEKSCEDNRVTFVRLTEKGRELKPSFTEISERLNAVVYQGLSDQEAEYLEAALDKLNRDLNE
ncbi:MarR family winged helix-turn-helix transcriptional regulator [Sporomusa sp.]|jgi:DNA-binding MarR family transcriptional regulator|uniref:MarR family winged helix-turn-helix transcriptional regulator n=1 Tax=Sporomusa sp. TaxID=2078658 RepID=UPI002C97EC5E|nr:MarR family transcriptional regulator [Sporomusa sp.]HWR05697.1 MarR family transcriptional regulator [Sporomusa sp.]